MKLNLFKRSTSVDNILSTFSKTVKKLEDHSVEMQEKAAKKHAAASAAKLIAEAAEAESAKAIAAASKIQTFLA